MIFELVKLVVAATKLQPSHEFKQVVLELPKGKTRSAQRQSSVYHFLASYLPLLPVLPDLPEISVSHVNLTVREGDNAVITCNGSGSPLPDVDWIVTGLQSINTHQVGIL